MKLKIIVIGIWGFLIMSCQFINSPKVSINKDSIVRVFADSLKAHTRDSILQAYSESLVAKKRDSIIKANDDFLYQLRKNLGKKNRKVLDSIYYSRNMSPDFFRVTYKQKVNGYQVFVWFIWYNQSAILTFIKDWHNFSILIPSFSYNLFEDKNDLMSEVLNSKDYSLELDYVQPKFEKSKYKYAAGYRMDSSNVPFLFLDINFDGVKELLINRKRQGQRGRDLFEVYVLEEDMFSAIDNYVKAKEKPYNLIDSGTTIDWKNKQLTVYYSGGAACFSYETYGLVKGKLTLIKVVEHCSLDNNDEHVYTYSVKNGVKTLISKEKID